MAIKAKKVGNAIIGFVAILGIGLALAWLVGRLLTCAYEAAGDSMLTEGIFSIYSSLPGILFEDPFHIDFSHGAILASCIFLIAMPFLIGIAQISFGMKLANEDTGREHGDDRLATKKEAAGLLDKKNPKNNIFFSDLSGLAIHAYDKRTRALTEGLNLNHLCVGISGRGKTYNMVMSELFAAVGDALPYKKYGIRNLLRRIFNLLPFRIIRTILGFPVRVLRIRRQNKQPGLIATLKQRKAQATSLKNENKRVENAQAPSSARLSSFSQALAEAASDIAPKRESRAQRREKQQQVLAQINAGYDVINSDPKGENVKNTGWMFERAGFDVKVFNTIDFNGMHFNPLAYIPERRTDSCPIEHIKCSLAGNLQSDPTDDEGKERLTLSIEEQFEANVRKDAGLALAPHGRKEIGLTCKLHLHRKVSRYDDIKTTSRSAKELEEALKDKDLTPDAREELFLQRELKHIEESIGGYQKTEDGDTVRTSECKKVVETLKRISYSRSYGELFIEIKNFSTYKLGGNFTINLGRSLERLSNPEAFGNATITSLETYAADDPNNTSGDLKITLHLDNLAPADRDGMPSHFILKVPVAIVAQRVADGIMLTKVVDTLVSNLHGTDAKSAGMANAEFWEETKRLELMAIIAYLFERYDKKYRTLPQMFRLLNLATPPEDGARGAKTPLDILMEEWQTGRRIEEAPANKDSDVRGAGATVHWVATDTPPHDINTSIALHCHLAIKRTAEDTYKSVIITCKAALMNLIADDVQEFLSDDEMALDTLGDPDQKQVIFLISQDTDSPYDFISALFIQLALDLALERAFRHGGKLDRHVRFVLDEVANIGKIPILIRALAVVRSRNISISMFAQSRSQLFKVYSREETDILFDNCSTISYLGAQSKETLEDISLRIGKETVYSRVFTRQFEGGLYGTRSSENIQATSREVQSPSQLRRLCQGTIIVMIFGQYAILDKKFQTYRHGLYPYVYPGSDRTLMQPACVCEPYDYSKKIREKRKRKEGR